ncbi:flagellar protein FlhE [Cedecea colo]|uniref:Flagellar protein FlhE n=2 Tax=Cedecea colo TaxID=2552946 RepID=A0ABX0VPV1_9ENTR|nr:flagellar protein FlhE [Cedecea colo]NIY48674.1 flagellar protein FlhE [Cedecea colo]
MVLAALLFPPAAFATGGAWHQKTAGVVISVGKQTMAGAALSAPADLPASAQASLLAWRVTLLTPPPAGLEIKLCSAATCIKLAGLSGRKKLTAPLSARGPFRFVYSVAGRGQLIPALHVVSNELTVNYRRVIPEPGF